MANDLAAVLLDAKQAVEDAKAQGKNQLDATTLHSIRVRYGRLVAKGFDTNTKPKFVKRSGYEKKAYNLLIRLDTYRADVLRFATDFRASFDNNQAERDIRMVKLQQKFRDPGAPSRGPCFCAIRSYVSTLRKHDREVLGGLRPAVRGSRLATQRHLNSYSHTIRSATALKGSTSLAGRQGKLVDHSVTENVPVLDNTFPNVPDAWLNTIGAEGIGTGWDNGVENLTISGNDVTARDWGIALWGGETYGDGFFRTTWFATLTSVVTMLSKPRGR